MLFKLIFETEFNLSINLLLLIYNFVVIILMVISITKLLYHSLFYNEVFFMSLKKMKNSSKLQIY